jgi:hypothetical protein
MAIILDAATELIAHALDFVEQEAFALDWLDRNKEAMEADLEATSAQVARGETYSPEESRTLLAQHRVTRTANQRLNLLPWPPRRRHIPLIQRPPDQSLDDSLPTDIQPRSLAVKLLQHRGGEVHIHPLHRL